MRPARSRKWLAAAVALAACSSAPRERIVLGTAHLPAMGLVYVAHVKGYFAARGLEVEQRSFTSGRDAVAALAEGRVDVATSLETPIVLRGGRDPALRVLTSLHATTGATRLVARGDRGISSPADLAGKRVGVPRNTNAEYFLGVLLAWAGVPHGEVRVVELAPEATPDAIASGEVDAVAIWTPHAERSRRMAGAAAVEIGSDVYTEISVLVTRAQVLAARRAALVKLVAALADAERLVRERPWEAFEALRAAFPEIGERDLAEAWRIAHPRLGLSHQLAAVLEDESRWFRTAGRLEGPALDVGVLLDPGVLLQVDPDAVTFVPPPRRAGAR